MGLVGRAWPTLSGDALLVESLHVFRDVIEIVLDGEMAGTQPVHLSIGQILEIRFTTLTCEENVVLAPEKDRVRFLFPKERLPLGIKPERAEGESGETPRPGPRCRDLPPRALVPLLPHQHQCIGGGAQGIACRRRDCRHHARSAEIRG